MVLVSALILNTRNCQQAVRCAQALRAQTVADDMEILVIDNHSEDDSIGVLRNRLGDDPRIRIIENRDNLGFGGGYNRGVHYARGRYILINNPDKILPPDGVERLLAKLQSDDRIGVLAPALRHDDGTYRRSPRSLPRPLDLLAKRTFLRAVFPHRLRRYLQLDDDPTTERAVDWVAGGCILLRRDLYRELGGFDERFFLFFEDIDLCRRIAAKGYAIQYYPQVVGRDKKRRFSDGGIFTLVRTKVGRAHLLSGVKYFWKWGL